MTGAPSHVAKVPVDDANELYARGRGGLDTLTLCIERIHHARHHLDAVLEGEVYKVGIDEDAVGWS